MYISVFRQFGIEYPICVRLHDLTSFLYLFLGSVPGALSTNQIQHIIEVDWILIVYYLTFLTPGLWDKIKLFLHLTQSWVILLQRQKRYGCQIMECNLGLYYLRSHSLPQETNLTKYDIQSWKLHLESKYLNKLYKIRH